MKIICCDASAEAAQLAFGLRYKVFGAELNFQDPDINAADGTYIDELDKHARIYVAIKDGEAIATARAISVSRSSRFSISSRIDCSKNTWRPRPALFAR